MTPHEADVALIALAAMLILAAIAGCYYLSRWLRAARYQAKQARHTRRPFADPADDTDPDGGQYIRTLRDDDVWTHTIMLPAPVPEDARDVLARVRDRILTLPPPPRLDDTGPLPHAVGTWGMPAHDLVDQLARTHMETGR